MEENARDVVTISVPSVSGEEAAVATDLIEHLLEKYKISMVDADALTNAMAAIYIRGRIVHKDRPPSRCSFAGCLAEDDAERN